MDLPGWVYLLLFCCSIWLIVAAVAVAGVYRAGGMNKRMDELNDERIAKKKGGG